LFSPVAKVFEELKPRERTLLWLAYVEGESHEEIAASLGVPPERQSDADSREAAPSGSPAGPRHPGEVMTDWFDLRDDEERAIAMFMSRVANVGVPDPELPILSSNTLWWKAKLLDKWEAERRTQWPLDIMQPIEIAGGLVAAGLLLYWSLPYLL
jgi:hypothetical protein